MTEKPAWLPEVTLDHARAVTGRIAPGYTDVLGNHVMEGDRVVYGITIGTIQDILQDGDARIDLDDGKCISVKWHRCTLLSIKEYVLKLQELHNNLIRATAHNAEAEIRRIMVKMRATINDGIGKEPPATDMMKHQLQHHQGTNDMGTIPPRLMGMPRRPCGEIGVMRDEPMTATELAALIEGATDLPPLGDERRRRIPGQRPIRQDECSHHRMTLQCPVCSKLPRECPAGFVGRLPDATSAPFYRPDMEEIPPEGMKPTRMGAEFVRTTPVPPPPDAGRYHTLPPLTVPVITTPETADIARLRAEGAFNHPLPDNSPSGDDDYYGGHGDGGF